MADKLFDPVELAWFCGLFEGEGCVSCHPNGAGSMTRRLIIQMTDFDILQRVQEFAGGRLNGPYAKPGVKEQYTWTVGRWYDIQPLALAMIPHMGERRTLALERLLANPPENPRAKPYVKAGDNIG